MDEEKQHLVNAPVKKIKKKSTPKQQAPTTNQNTKYDYNKALAGLLGSNNNKSNTSKQTSQKPSGPKCPPTLGIIYVVPMSVQLAGFFIL